MGNWSCFRPRGVTAITAKLIHWDGELEEFSFPVRVSSLRAGNEDSEVLIVCDADEMGLEEFVSAVEDLVPGKLYFELPGSWVSRRLRAEVMGSLAVKASTALAASGGAGERFRCCFIGGAARKGYCEAEGNIGAWMLVTRKDRRGQRMENHNSGSHNRDRNRNQPNYTNPAGLVTNSRYAVLEQMNDNETEYAQGNNIPVAPFNSTPKNLPRIRTSPQTQQTQRVTNQERIPQPQNFTQPQPRGRGGLGNRGGRGGAPRRAAAESEHTVVRGSRLGKQVASTVVHNQCDMPESSHRTDMDYELLGDPPDIPRGSSSRLNDVDATMSDETGVGQVASEQ
nr:uncharacterized protein LOC109164574 [Ipomoea batatas]